MGRQPGEGRTVPTSTASCRGEPGASARGETNASACARDRPRPRHGPGGQGTGTRSGRWQPGGSSGGCLIRRPGGNRVRNGRGRVVGRRWPAGGSAGGGRTSRAPAAPLQDRGADGDRRRLRSDWGGHSSGRIQLSLKALKGKDPIFTTSLQDDRPAPSAGGPDDSTQAHDPVPGRTRRRRDLPRCPPSQTVLSGIDWPTVLQVADTRVLDFLPRERF